MLTLWSTTGSSASLYVITSRLQKKTDRMSQLPFPTLCSKKCPEEVEKTRKFSPQLRDKIWEWPGNEATVSPFQEFAISGSTILRVAYHNTE